jgi:hypothetical protein
MSSEEPTPTAGDFTHLIAKSVADLRELLAPLDEATLGYRRHLETQGWSPPVAEQMALWFYAAKMAGFVAAAGKPS